MGRRRVCYVTGTRAEFGLMASTLRAIRGHVDLDLQLVVTGMHLSREHGRTVDQIRRDGWTIDATVPWKGETPAAATGQATTKLAAAFAKLRPDVVLVCGDRVEPFAAASAAHLDGILVAHVHGGDRAMGQADDTLRHAISKLSHIHFPATKQSAERLYQLGEDRFRIHAVGTPGVDDIEPASYSATSGLPRWPLVVLHPETADEASEREHALMILKSIEAAGIHRAHLIGPNNDPGWRGISRAWTDAASPEFPFDENVDRPGFLERMAGSAMLIGNSSSGIIEAASVGVLVVNVGDRQKGRERSKNVIDVPWSVPAITKAVRAIWNNGKPKRFTGKNVYGGGDAGRRMAAILADVDLDEPRLRRKLIRY